MAASNGQASTTKAEEITRIPQEKAPEVSLVDFCTQLEDYTPTVAPMISDIQLIMYFIMYRYPMQ